MKSIPPEINSVHFWGLSGVKSCLLRIPKDVNFESEGLLLKTQRREEWERHVESRKPAASNTATNQERKNWFWWNWDVYAVGTCEEKDAGNLISISFEAPIQRFVGSERPWFLLSSSGHFRLTDRQLSSSGDVFSGKAALRTSITQHLTKVKLRLASECSWNFGWRQELSRTRVRVI